MLTFKQYLAEEEKKMNANTLVSDVNELLVGYYANGKKWYDQDAKRKYEERVKQISPEDLARADGHAQAMVQSFFSYAKAKGYKLPVIGVYWTARAGSMTRLTGVEVDQTKNPTDTLIRFSSGPADGWLGLSAKSTKTKGEIGFKNPGLGTIDRVLNIKISQEYKNQLNQAIEELGLPVSGTERKDFIRSNAAIKKKTEALGSQMLSAMRDELYSKLNTLKSKELYSHVVDEWMNAEPMFPPYVKITGKGNKPPFTTSVIDPQSNDKLDALATLKFKLERVGNDSIGIMADGKKVMKMRFKFESEKLASSVKMSGESW